MEFDDERVIVKYNYNYGHEEIKIFDYHVNHNLISGYVEMTDRSLGSDKNRYIRLYDNNEHFGDCRWDRKNQNIFYGDIVLQQK